MRSSFKNITIDQLDLLPEISDFSLQALEETHLAIRTPGFDLSGYSSQCAPCSSSHHHHVHFIWKKSTQNLALHCR